MDGRIIMVIKRGKETELKQGGRKGKEIHRKKGCRDNEKQLR